MKYHLTFEREIIEDGGDSILTVAIGEKQAQEIFRQVLTQKIADDIRQYGYCEHSAKDIDAEKLAETVIRFYDTDISYWNNIERAFEYLESDIKGKRNLK